MPQPLKVLVVEDNPDDAKMVLHELTRSGLETISQRVDTEAAFLAGLDGGLDLILCDYTMPEFSGLRALELLKKRGLEIPLIIVSGTIGEEIAVEAMRLGAADYLFKDRLARLGPSVHQALEQVRLRKERRKLEAELIEAQKMEVIGQLASGVAHDFNNLLSVIMGYSDLMMVKLEADSPLQKDAQTIRHAADRAAGLTRQLLIFSRKQTVQPVVLDLNEVVGDMKKMLGRLIDENVELIFALGPQIGRLKADSGYVGQVLMNLVVNARDAMPNGGKITVETGNATLDQDYARAHPDAAPGEYVMLSVSDTGTGMTDEVKAHMFKAFFTTKPKGKGTGLGLATCQTIVQQSGGHIAVSSQVGQGATFRVYFPQVQEAIKLSDTSFIRKQPLPRGTETLLVVEDEPAVRHLACDVLRAKGYEVLSATNGKDGLHVARQHKGAAIRLVITDVIMPQMGGRVMAEWLKSSFPGIKILYTSGYTDDAVTHHGVLDQGVAFLPKPYTPATLTRAVRELLDAPETTPL
jgi:signal transduction histidine kinase